MERENGAADTRDITYSTFDGLKLHARHYPAANTTADVAPRPLLCLAGLSRNARDFHDIALYLSRHPDRPRDVYCLDYRGRGKSEFDENPKNYSPLVEARDIIDFLTIYGLHEVAVLGTSRGGIIAMILGAIRPTALGAVILNDIGPVIESSGFIRIMGYVGKTPAPGDWDTATQLVRQMNERYFPALSEKDWQRLARQIFDDRDGRPVSSYDPKISEEFSKVDITEPLPEFWPQFMSLNKRPLMILRGENSDVLSADTAKRMAALHPNCKTVVVKDQGHPPLLLDRETQDEVSAFLIKTDG